MIIITIEIKCAIQDLDILTLNREELYKSKKKNKFGILMNNFRNMSL